MLCKWHLMSHVLLLLLLMYLPLELFVWDAYSDHSIADNFSQSTVEINLTSTSANV